MGTCTGGTVLTRSFRSLSLVSFAALAAVSFAAVVFAMGGRPLSAEMTGAQEVPGPGDPDGSGSAEVTVNPGTGEVCYTLTVTNIAPALAAHIHVGAAGVAGPVVVPLLAPSGGSSSDCVEVDRELALALVQSPENYYVNVHNSAFPAGAVRGQLGK